MREIFEQFGFFITVGIFLLLDFLVRTMRRRAEAGGETNGDVGERNYDRGDVPTRGTGPTEEWEVRRPASPSPPRPTRSAAQTLKPRQPMAVTAPLHRPAARPRPRWEWGEGEVRRGIVLMTVLGPCRSEQMAQGRDSLSPF